MVTPMIKESKTLKKQVLLYAQYGDIDGLKKISFEISLHWTRCLLPTGDTPLHVAAQNGKEDVIRFLLDEWTNDHDNVDIISSSGKTALHEAAQFGRPAVVSLLLKKGANPRALKQADWTPLMLACTKTGSTAFECCKLLFAAGKSDSLKDQNKDGWTAFHIAVREGDLEIIEWLLNIDPSVSATQSNNGRTPLHTAALHGLSEVVSLLLAFGCNSNTRDSCGSTPIHDAVRSGSIDTLRILISNNGDIRRTNILGQSAVHMAAETGDSAMLKFLFDKCHLCVNYGSFTCTPLHCAIRAKKTDAVQTLLKYGANPTAADSCGYTCMDIAKTCTLDDLLKILSVDDRTEGSPPNQDA